MVLNVKFNSLQDLYQLQHLAAQSGRTVLVGSEDDAIRADACSCLGLMALDYSRPVNIITDSEQVIEQLKFYMSSRDHSVRA